MAEQVMTQAPGNVWKVLVKEGDKVSAGDTLFILEVMKTEVPHEAETSGTVSSISVELSTTSVVSSLGVTIIFSYY